MWFSFVLNLLYVFCCYVIMFSSCATFWAKKKVFTDVLFCGASETEKARFAASVKISAICEVV